jgi:MSHA biogenesis protein MshO
MRQPNPQAARMVAGRAAGFTLIELVVVIAITAIIAGIMVLLIATPTQAYFAQTRRAMLVDSANSARRLIGADVRSALPNSVRPWSNGNIRMLELLATTYNAAYFSEPPLSPNPLLDLTVGTPDADFATVGLFGNPVPPNTGYVVVNNLGTPPAADAYTLTNVIAPVTTITAGTAPQPGNPPIDSVHLNPGFNFVADSPAHRVFLVSGPVAYLCDQSAQTLTRYWGYGISASPGAHDSAAKMLAAGAQSALVARNITSCAFGATAGTAQHGQLVMLQMLLSNGGENLPIMEEVSEDNPS